MSAPPKKKGLTGPDREFENELTKCLNILVNHSNACWQFAFKNYEKFGRGCVFWLVKSLADARAVKDNQKFPLLYRDRNECQQMAYGPVMEFMDMYDPARECLLLVAIKTGDKRDSFMKVVRASRSLQDTLRAKVDPATVDTWGEAGVVCLHRSDLSKTMRIIEGGSLCGNPLCTQSEEKLNQFKACASCRFRQYCSRECQVVHWKTSHKAGCAAEKAIKESSLVDAGSSKAAMSPQELQRALLELQELKSRMEQSGLNPAEAERELEERTKALAARLKLDSLEPAVRSVPATAAPAPATEPAAATTAGSTEESA